MGIQETMKAVTRISKTNPSIGFERGKAEPSVVVRCGRNPGKTASAPRGLRIAVTEHCRPRTWVVKGPWAPGVPSHRHWTWMVHCILVGDRTQWLRSRRLPVQACVATLQVTQLLVASARWLLRHSMREARRQPQGLCWHFAAGVLEVASLMVQLVDVTELMVRSPSVIHVWLWRVTS